METPLSFFEEYIGQSATSFVEIPQSGSARRNYIAEYQDKKYIVTTNSNTRENECFIYLSAIFDQLEMNTPKIHHISNDKKIYIQEFLGAHTLSEIISKEGLSPRIITLVKKTLFALRKLQTTTQNTIDYSKAYEYEKYDSIPILHDLNYFKFLFADILEAHYHRSHLLKEFSQLATEIEHLQPRGVMIRDFQSRNILVDDKDDVFFIDYQSIMEGPLMYDVVSFLYQAKANFPEKFRNEMLEYYYSLFDSNAEVLQLKEAIYPIRLMRNLQVLGVYGFRGLVQRKSHFIHSIPQALQNLQSIATDWQEIKKYPELEQLIFQLCSKETQQKIEKLL